MKNGKEEKQQRTCVSFVADLSGCPPKNKVYTKLPSTQHMNIK